MVYFSTCLSHLQFLSSWSYSFQVHVFCFSEVKWSESHSVVSNRGVCDPTDYVVHGMPGQNTGVGNRSLLQGISPAQGSNPGLQHCRQVLYQLSCQGSFAFVGRFIPGYFNIFVVIVNGIISSSLSVISLLVHRNATDFYILILYPATLSDSLMSSDSFLMLLYDFLCKYPIICKQSTCDF